MHIRIRNMYKSTVTAETQGIFSKLRLKQRCLCKEEGIVSGREALKFSSRANDVPNFYWNCHQNVPVSVCVCVWVCACIRTKCVRERQSVLCVCVFCAYLTVILWPSPALFYIRRCRNLPAKERERKSIIRMRSTSGKLTKQINWLYDMCVWKFANFPLSVFIKKVCWRAKKNPQQPTAIGKTFW